MQFILAAILVLVGTGPFCDWVLLSPYAHYVWDFQQSVAIKSLLVHPDLLLAGGFMMGCYGIAGELLGLARALVPTPRYLYADAKSVQAGKTSARDVARKPTLPHRAA